MTSMPPRVSPAWVTNAFSAGPSAMSVACPQALTPLAFSASTAAATWSALRAQIATSAPSSANRSAIDRPIPRDPPVTTTFLPLSPRSMFNSPFLVGRDPNRGATLAQA
jgi:hypothetical protein